MQATGTRFVPLLRGAAIALGATGLVSAGFLIVSTTRMEALVSRISTAVETVYMAGQAERALLVHSRSSELLSITRSKSHESERDQGQRDLKVALTRLAQLANSPHEQQLINEAAENARRYLHLRAQLENENQPEPKIIAEVTPFLERAQAALAEVVRVNHVESGELEHAADVENARANAIGWFVATIDLLVVLAVFYVLNRAVRRPFTRMKRLLAKIEAGRLAVLPVEGPAELREIALVFNDLIEQLRDHRERQLRFLAGVAHDLRTPLNAMNLSLRLLEGENLSRGQRETLSACVRQVSELDRQVGDLLDQTRIESGQMELRITEHDLIAIVEKCANVFRGLSARHSIHIAAPPRPLFYACDPTRVGQLLNNLLSNAIKYSPSGGDIALTVHADDSIIKISVQDEGIGIPPEDLPHVFQPFRRTAATRETVPGVGLGLSVARRIAEAHGGTIEVTSIPATGSTFVLLLPRR